MSINYLNIFWIYEPLKCVVPITYLQSSNSFVQIPPNLSHSHSNFDIDLCHCRQILAICIPAKKSNFVLSGRQESKKGKRW